MSRFWNGLILLLAVAALFSGCGFFKPGPGRTLELFLYALQDGKIEEAKSYCSSAMLNNYGQKLTQQFMQAPQSIMARGGIQSTEIIEESITGDIASVSLRVHFGDGGEELMQQDFIKENGTWKLSARK